MTMLKAQEAAKMLGITSRTVVAWIRLGRLKGVRINSGSGQYRVPEEEVQRMLRPVPTGGKKKAS